MVRVKAIGELATFVLSAPMIVVGLGIMSLAGNWAERGAGAALVTGASLALAARGWPARTLAWSLALIGAPIVAALLSAR